MGYDTYELEKVKIAYLKAIHEDLARLIEALENIKDHGIIAYPSA